MAQATERAAAPALADSSAVAPIEALPSALTSIGDIERRIGRLTPVFCLDFDGTLSPIVADPGAACLLDGVEGVLRALAAKAPILVLSGRDAPDVRARIRLPGVLYAGSHGFEVLGDDGQREVHEEALRYLPHLAVVEEQLRAATAGIPGVVVDRKRFSVAVHDRMVPEEHLESLWRVVAGIAAESPMLRSMRGKRVTEFLPNLDWDKGRALLWLLEMSSYRPDRHLPICIGDDITDEDALRTVRGPGIGIVVGSGERPTAATYALRDPVEVREFLSRMLQFLDERAGADA